MMVKKQVITPLKEKSQTITNDTQKKYIGISTVKLANSFGNWKQLLVIFVFFIEHFIEI